MLPRPGCEEIFEARSSVSEDEGTKDVLPAAGRVFVRGSMGRRGVRRDIWRVDEGVDILVGWSDAWREGLGERYVLVCWCYAWSEECRCAGCRARGDPQAPEGVHDLCWSRNCLLSACCTVLVVAWPRYADASVQFGMPVAKSAKLTQSLPSVRKKLAGLLPKT